MTSTRSLAWLIWLRNSLALKAIGGIMLVASLYFRFFHATEAFIPVILTLLVFFSYLGLMGIFMYQVSDVGVKGSSYPSHMFSLPVRTSQLVFTPMALGTATFLLSGLIFSAAIARGEHGFPLFFPAFFMTALYTMLTAIFWYPFGVPYSKLFLTLVGIPIMIFLVVYAFEYKNSEESVCVWLTVFIAVCFVIAYRGVIKARRGELYVFWWQTLEAKPKRSKPVKCLKFRDKIIAQRWYEWRQQGIILPSLVAFLCLVFLIPNYWNDTNSVSTIFGPDSNGMTPMFPTYLSTYINLMLWLVPVTAWVVGCGARRNEVKNSDRSFYLFFGTRPMSDGALVAQKLWAAVRSSVISWAVVLCCLLFILPMHGTSYNAESSLITKEPTTILAMLIHFSNLRAIGFVLGGLVLLMIVTWRNFVVGFWTEMSGQKWLRLGYPAVLLISIVGGSSLPGNIRGNEVIALYSLIAILVWVIIAARIAIAIYLCRKQLQGGLLSRDNLLRGIRVYVVGILFIVALALWLSTGMRYMFMEYMHFSYLWTIMTVIGLVILWTPFVRILLAVEMLHRNRHRAM
jgi:hypothetical protein